MLVGSEYVSVSVMDAVGKVNVSVAVPVIVGKVNVSVGSVYVSVGRV